MTAISLKSSVLGVKIETTEGVYVAPGAATDYVPLQDNFTMQPALESLQNAEIRASIGVAAPIVGAEKPTASGAFYMKANSVEGSAPAWSDIAKAFFGTQTIEGTQRSFTSGSTTALLEMTSASSLVVRGYGMLIKDGTNGYRVRVVHSVATTHITPSFNLPAAPASGVTTGKPVFWSPANSGHPSLAVSYYAGNGGAVLAAAGMRPIELGFEMTAGQLINGNVSLEGLSFYFDPIEITASTKYIDFTDDDGTVAAIIPVKIYKTPKELADAVALAMNTANGAQVVTCTYSNTTGMFTILSTGTLLTLKWNTGANTANTAAAKLGFSAAADSTGTVATTGYTSASALTLTSPYTPTFDASEPTVAKYQEVMIGDQADYACFNASKVTVKGTQSLKLIQSICAESGRSGSVFTGRNWEISVTALLTQYDANFMARYFEGATTRFQTTYGSKVGGNWTAGSVVYCYAPTCKVSAIVINNDEGLASLQLTLKPFVNSDGEGELYIGTL